MPTLNPRKNEGMECDAKTIFLRFIQEIAKVRTIWRLLLLPLDMSAKFTPWLVRNFSFGRRYTAKQVEHLPLKTAGIFGLLFHVIRM